MLVRQGKWRFQRRLVPRTALLQVAQTASLLSEATKATCSSRASKPRLARGSGTSHCTVLLLLWHRNAHSPRQRPALSHSRRQILLQQSPWVGGQFKACRVDPNARGANGAGAFAPSLALKKPRQARSPPVTACMSFGGADGSSQAAGESSSEGPKAKRDCRFRSSLSSRSVCVALPRAALGVACDAAATCGSFTGAGIRALGAPPAASVAGCCLMLELPSHGTCPRRSPAHSVPFEASGHARAACMVPVLICATLPSAVGGCAQGLAPAAGLALPHWE